MEIENIKVIVFDLDGTLYEDTHHFDYYAKRLNEKVNSPYKAHFGIDYKKAKDGKHPLRIGRVYDIYEDLILVHHHCQVIAAYEWDGREVPREKVTHHYLSPIVLDFDTMLNIGDLWWIPAAIAYHYGVTNNQVEKAFLETRKFMMRDEFQLQKIAHFKGVLQELRDHTKLILLTNSPEPDSRVILQKLGLQHTFHRTTFLAKKPIDTKKHFTAIKHIFGVKYNEILSIGDNWINDILPAGELGCLTMYIDPHNIGQENAADLIVPSIRDVIPLLKKRTCF
ncbi:HAD family hydrolase [Bacillus spongiae]|uniref:HAD family hydrolase n=1 Tax=Bacillus spongiae TaxID=2683610 RepID=A0ABU8HGR3_9BACI